jgi:hypothetical protein
METVGHRRQKYHKLKGVSPLPILWDISPEKKVAYITYIPAPPTSLLIISQANYIPSGWWFQPL